jgi:parvulin-like peptidyl-prolyl isomerase
MKYSVLICVMALLAVSSMSAQMAVSHEPTNQAATPDSNKWFAASAPNAGVLANRPVARVNGTVLTDRDLQREEYAIFPYANQHNGIPKGMEAQIRKGAMQMIVFEELVYQEAERQKFTITQARMDEAMAQFRKQFTSPDEYKEFMKVELGGSQELLRARIRRSLLIDAYLKQAVQDKSTVTLAEAKAYYDKNPDKFRTSESFSIQSISLIPPDKANGAQLQEARKHAREALLQAKATQSYEQFGVLAEKISEDDYRVMMGDHKAVDKAKLPPQLLQALLAMKPGQVSDLIQIDTFYTIIRLNAHNAAGIKTFDEVKDSLRKDLTTKKTEQLRAALDKKLRASAKVEEL